MKFYRVLPVWLVYTGLFLLVNASKADEYIDMFTSGIDTVYWNVISEDTLYAVDDSNSEVRFSRKAGGEQNFKTVRLVFQPHVYGDFDISVQFREAYIDRVNGSPGNQIQLNTRFGGQVFSVVRSDENGFGHNHHVWIDPPGQWRNDSPDTSASGKLRITRVGSIVTGFFNQDTVFSGTFNAAELEQPSISLQNNQTSDSTSVIFDNYILTADSIGGMVTRIIQRQISGSTTQLHQNHPNPFNATTKIQYAIPKPENVRIEVYNVLGQVVKLLLDKQMPAGFHETSFNAKDLSSGIYFYKIRAGGFQDVKKMILIR